MMAGPDLGNVVDPVDVELGVREEQRMREAERQALDLHVDDGNPGHPVGGRREIDRRPSTRRGHDGHPRIRIDDERMPYGGQQRCVVHAVAVGVARRQIDAMLVGPRTDRGKFACTPHEGAIERPGIGAITVDAIPSGDHVVEAQQVGERLDHVERARRGHHNGTPCGAMLVEQGRGERLHQGQQAVRSQLGSSLYRGLRLAPRQGDGLARQRHRGHGLADGVEQAEQKALTRDRAVDQPGFLHRCREHLAGGAGQQGSIEIEEGGTRAGGRRAGGHQRDCTPKREKPRLGEAGFLNQNPVIGGTTLGGSFERNQLGVGTVRLHVKVCT